MLRKKQKSKREIALFLLVIVGLALTIAYARYASNATSTMAAQVAPWKVSINSNDIVSTNTFTLEDIVWSENEYIADGYIAPGRTGTLTIEIDPSGSKVAMRYKVEIDESNITNDSISITGITASTGSVIKEEDGTYTGIIPLEGVTNNTKKILTIAVEWSNPETVETDTNDTTTGMDSSNFQVPITVTASQLVE